MKKQFKIQLMRILTACALLVCAGICGHFEILPGWFSVFLYLAAYFIAGYDIITKAGESLVNKKFFDRNVLIFTVTLMCIITGFIPSFSPRFFRAVFVMTVCRTETFVIDLINERRNIFLYRIHDPLLPYAFADSFGGTVKTKTEQLQVGDIVTVRSGETVPADGVVTDGSALLDISFISGQDARREVSAKDAVLSGSLCISGLIKIRVSEKPCNSTASLLLRSISDADKKPPQICKSLSAFTCLFVPVTVIMSLAAAFLLPLLLGGYSSAFDVWFDRAMTVITVCSPCSLIASLALCFECGMAEAAKSGIIVREPHILEKTAKAGTVVIDSTDVLNHTDVAIKIFPGCRFSEKTLMTVAGAAERCCVYPISVPFRTFMSGQKENYIFENIREYRGMGMTAELDSIEICFGCRRFCEESGINISGVKDGENTFFLALDGKAAAGFSVMETVSQNAAEELKILKKSGIENIILMSEYEKDSVKYENPPFCKCLYGLSFTDKYHELGKAMKSKKKKSEVIFFSNGKEQENVEKADVGISAVKSDPYRFLPYSDMITLNRSEGFISAPLNIAERTVNKAKMNIIMCSAMKITLLVLALCGVMPLCPAVFFDISMNLIAFFNAWHSGIL